MNKRLSVTTHNLQKARKAGFTLIETLVAVTIVVTAIAGPLTIASRGLSSAFFARDQIAAFYLAQEAVEYVRNIRDTNILAKNSDWLSGFSSCLSGSCTIDATKLSVGEAVAACPASGCPALKYNSASGLYNQQTGENSPFTRSVRIVSINGNEASVEVTISWRTGIFSRQFKVRENILNWGQEPPPPPAPSPEPPPPPPNYYTLNPTPNVSPFTISNGNLTISRGGAGDNTYRFFSGLPQSGKWYFEVYVDSYSGSPQPMLGIVGSDKVQGDGSFNQGGDGYMYNFQSEYYRDNNFDNDGAKNFGSDGSIMAIAYDADTKKIWVGGRTGSGGAFSWVNPGGATPDPASGVNPFDSFTGATGSRRVAMSNTNNAGSWQITFNFGSGSIPGATYQSTAGGSFVFTVPAGFSAITN